jgi:hypothetical protein
MEGKYQIFRASAFLDRAVAILEVVTRLVMVGGLGGDGIFLSPI